MKHSLFAALIVAGAIVASPLSHAQFGSRSLMVQAFEPYIMQRDMPLMVAILDLDETQRPIVDMLLEDYMASFAAGIEKVRAQMQDAGSAAKEDLTALLRPLNNWSRERQELYNRFAETMKSVLSPQQLDRWPAFERAIRRERLLPQSEISGEGVNLIGIINDLAPPAEVRATAQPVIEAYEIRIDGALTERQAREEENMGPMMDAMVTMDHQRAAELQDRIMAARVRLRDAQEISIEEISTALGADWGPRFRVIAMQRAFPEVFSPNSVIRLFDAALEIADLTPEQRASITSLKGEMEREWEGLSREMLTVVKRDEPAAPKRRAAAPAERQGRSPELEAMRRKRQDLAERYRQQLEHILTPEQYADLPGAQRHAAQGLGKQFGPATPGGGGVTTMPKGGGDRGAGADDAAPIPPTAIE